MLEFGTSGIRDLSVNLLKNKTAAELARHLVKLGFTEIAIGRDGRRDSGELTNEFVAAFGDGARNYGIVTTPFMASLGGLSVMVTASHNSAPYCGFKLFLDGRELPGLDNLCPRSYWDKITQLPRDIVIDCANGALGYKLKQCGFDNIINYSGEINQNCGATHPENIANYCRGKYDVGFAVDGDADRVIMFLQNRVLDGDELAFLIASLLRARRIVADETMNSGLCGRFDVQRCAVGGTNVLDMMLANNIEFGAEKSGHYYFGTRVGVSDALDTIILLSKYETRELQEILCGYHPDQQLNRSVKIAELKPDYKNIIGRAKLKDVRSVIRLSGTEPLLRIMLEGRDRSVVEQNMKNLLKKILR
jgi:phosphomannomutase